MAPQRRSRAAGADDGTAGGVDTAATKKHLLGIARRLDVRGRSRMTKDELVEGIARANDRATARSRDRDQDG